MCGTLLKKRAGACEAKYLNAEKFEEAVIKEIRDRQESLALTKMELEDKFSDRQVQLSDFKFI